MKKIFSLFKACMTDNMNLFKIKSKKQSGISKIILPVFLFGFIFVYILSFANLIIEPLVEVKQEYVLLSLFVSFTFIMTLIEGIYKSSGLLFNCKDDNLLLSLPIKKSTVLFIRVFKFYLFELMYNSLFLLPAMIAYANNVNVGSTYYLVSLFDLIRCNKYSIQLNMDVVLFHHQLNLLLYIYHHNLLVTLIHNQMVLRIIHH